VAARDAYDSFRCDFPFLAVFPGDLSFNLFVVVA